MPIILTEKTDFVRESNYLALKYIDTRQNAPKHKLMVQSFLLSFTALFVAIDIIGGVPMYISITKDFPNLERKKIVRRSMLVAFAVALVFLGFGQTLLHHLGITLGDFRIAGGIVLLMIALADMTSGPEKVHDVTGASGIVPLALPLITGPAALATIVLESGSRGYLITLASMLANYAIAWFVLEQCERIERILGKNGTVILSKIAALLLAAIAVAMIRNGIFSAIQEFKI